MSAAFSEGLRLVYARVKPDTSIPKVGEASRALPAQLLMDQPLAIITTSAGISFHRKKFLPTVIVTVGLLLTKAELVANFPFYLIGKSECFQ